MATPVGPIMLRVFVDVPVPYDQLERYQEFVAATPRVQVTTLLPHDGNVPVHVFGQVTGATQVYA